MIVGFICDATKIGFVKMAIIFIGSGVGGTLFGSLCSPNLAVGCDVAYFGFVGALLAAAIVNWHALAPIGMMRLCLIFMIVLLLVILILYTSSYSTTGSPYFV